MSGKHLGGGVGVISPNVADARFRMLQGDALELWVLYVEGEEALGRLFRFQIYVCVDTETADFVEEHTLVGQRASLELCSPEGGVRIIRGMVSDCEFAGVGRHHHYYVFTLSPTAWVLTQRVNCRIFQGQTTWQIIRKVMEDHGFQAGSDFHFASARPDAYPPRDYCVQYRESDWDFISRLMEEEGIYHFWRERDGASIMHLTDGPHGHFDVAFGPEVRFHAPDGLAPDPGTVHDLRVHRQIRPGVVSLKDYAARKPGMPLNVTVAEDAGAAEVFDYPGEYRDAGLGRRLAQVRLEELRTGFHGYAGRSTRMDFVPGHRFTLCDHLVPRFNRALLLTRVRHRVMTPMGADIGYAPGGGDMNGQSTRPSYENDFEAVPAEQPFRPARITPRPRVQGPQTAVVVGPEGEEIYTDALGRVKVRFHWDRGEQLARDGRKEADSSCWIRVSQGWAGGQYGTMFIPRIGQEVIVDFLEGDPDQPIIIGRVYNGDLMPPYPLPDEKTKSTIKTNSTKNSRRFHEIRFEDHNKHEQLFIRAQRRMDTRVIGTHYHTVGGSLHEQVGHEDDKGNQKGRYYRTVSEGIDLHNRGDQYELIEKDRHAVVQGNALDVVRKDYALFVSQGAEVSAQKVIIEAGQTIALKVGGNFVTIDPSGVTIQGTLTKINCGGTAPGVSPKEAKLPLDALPADTGKPGRDKVRKRKPRVREAVVVRPQRAPSMPAASAVAPALGAAIPVPPASKPCGIADLVVRCQHQRVPGPSRVLQVVATAVAPGDSTTVGGVPVAPVPDLLAKAVGAPEPTEATVSTVVPWTPAQAKFGVKKLTGGLDSVSIEVISRDKLAAGRKQIMIRRGTGPVREADWLCAAVGTDVVATGAAKLSYSVPPPSVRDDRPRCFKPDIYTVYGRGCDEVYHYVRLESFPSAQYEYTANLSPIKCITDEINGVLEPLLRDVLKEAIGVGLIVKVIPPQGEIKVLRGWKELPGDWRVYHSLEITAGLNPCFGFSLGVEAKVFKVIVTLLNSVAPVIASMIADFVSRGLFDVILSLELELSAFVMGGSQQKTFSTGEESRTGKVDVGGQGEVKGAVAPRLGNPAIVSVELRGEASGGIRVYGEFEVEHDGLYLSPHVETTSVRVGLVFEMRGFFIELHTQKVSWEIFPATSLYPAPKAPHPPRLMLVCLAEGRAMVGVGIDHRSAAERAGLK